MKRCSRKGLIICGSITAVIVMVAVIFVTLFFTTFKPRDPTLTPYPTKLQNVEISIFPLGINAILNMTITIHNPNYGNFRFEDTNSSVSYHGMYVMDIPIPGATVPARRSINITTSTGITTQKLVTSPDFFKDLESGYLNLTSTGDMKGRIDFLKIFKIGAHVLSSCDINIYIQSYDVISTCLGKLKI